jgi:hypothetical protein
MTLYEKFRRSRFAFRLAESCPWFNLAFSIVEPDDYPSGVEPLMWR